MKKLLLSAALVLSTLGASAQQPVKVEGKLPVPESAKVVKNFKLATERPFSLKNMQSRPATRAAAYAPAGEAKEFMVTDYESAYGFWDENGASYLYPRIRRQQVVFADGGTVHVPVMFLSSLFGEDAYIECSVDASGNLVIPTPFTLSFTLDNADYEILIAMLDMESMTILETPLTLTYNEAEGTYSMPESETEMLGALMDNGNGEYGIMTMMQGLTYANMATLDAQLDKVTYTYNYDQYTDTQLLGQTAEVQAWQDPEGTFISSTIMPYHPEAMFMLEKEDGVSITLPSGFIVADDMVAYGLTVQGNDVYTAQSATFEYDAATDSYVMPSNQMIGGLFYGADQTGQQIALYINDSYENLSLKLVGGGTGISAVETADKGAAVATEYYDLSGRRVSAAAQGVSIKVEKYADGTSKAVKVVK